MRFFPILLCSLVLSACSAPEADLPPSGAPLTDDLGRTLNLHQPPSRIVTLAPSLTEVLFAIGAGDRIAGVTTADNYPPEVDALERVQALPLDFERIARLRADLVLATDQINPVKDADLLADLGIPTYYTRFANVDDVPRVMRDLGTLLGLAAQAEQAARAMEDRLAAVEARVGDVSHRPRVLVLIGPDMPYVFGGDSYVNEMVRLAGGESITAALPDQAALLSEEFVLANPPDVIVLPQSTPLSAADLLKHHPTWSALPAIQNGRLYTLPPDWLLRPGPRIARAVELLASQLHPEPATP